MTSRISVNIVTWNSMDYLPDLMASIAEQTYDNFQVVVVDNASDDGVATFLHRNYPRVTVLRNMRNRGFAGAHNQGIRYVLDHWPDHDLGERYICITNPDVILQPDFVERLVARADTYPDSGSFTGKIYRAFGENVQDEVLKETVQSDRIDSVGLQPHKNRRFTDRGADVLDEGQFAEEEEVFGVSGALGCYRASALESIRHDGEYFDEDFFAYKEDVDLAWRLRLHGWSAHYIPAAQAYHYRGMYGMDAVGWIERLRHRRAQSPRRRMYSTRNHLYTLVKNESFLSMLLAAPHIAAHEGARLASTCVLTPGNLHAYVQALVHMPRMWKKRRHIMRSAKCRPSELRPWFK